MYSMFFIILPVLLTVFVIDVDNLLVYIVSYFDILGRQKRKVTKFLFFLLSFIWNLSQVFEWVILSDNDLLVCYIRPCLLRRTCLKSGHFQWLASMSPNLWWSGGLTLVGLGVKCHHYENESTTTMMFFLLMHRYHTQHICCWPQLLLQGPYFTKTAKCA